MYRYLTIIVVALTFMTPLNLPATEFRSGNVVHVDDPEVLDDLFAWGGDVRFNSHVAGDVFSGGRTVTLDDSAEVENSFMAFGQKIDVNGLVHNSARVFGQDLVLRGHVERNLMAFGSSILIDSRSWVENDVWAYGATLIVRGKIGGDLQGGANTITISGQVDGDVKVEGEEIVVMPSAIIGGTLRYDSKKEIKIEEGAQILGGVERLEPKTEEDGYSFGSFLWDAGWYLSSLALGALMILLFGGFMSDSANAIMGLTWKCLGVGALFLICLPVAAIAAALTIIGTPTAVLVLIAWAILVYISDIIVGLAVGKWLLGRRSATTIPSLYWGLALGLLLVTIVTKLPYLGNVIGIVVSALAMGAFFLVAHQRRSRSAE